MGQSQVPLRRAQKMIDLVELAFPSFVVARDVQ